MGIIPAIVVFLLVTLANVINTYYLIKANEGLKRRQLETKKGLQIDNDYANLMYQVIILFYFVYFLVIWKSWLLYFLSILLYDCMECNVRNNDWNVRFNQTTSLFRIFLRRRNSS